MIDVNKITSTLAKLPDAQLQQYAQMHKADPYIMALAMTESNRRKELRAAGQGAQGMQEMPKVVDQAVAEMAPQQLPEDMGIARIPAGDMNFAGGGIVAFADGGGVERYQVGGITAKYQQESMEMGMGTRMQYSPEVQAYAQAQEQASKASYADRERARMLQGPYSRTAAPAPAVPVALAAPPADYDPTENLKKIAQTNAKYVAASAPKSAEEAALLGRYPTNKPKAGDAAPKVDTDKVGTDKVGAPSTAATPMRGSASLEALYKKLNPSDAEYAALDTKETSVANALKNLGKSGLEEFEAEEAKRGDVFKGREERLAKREGELEGMKDKNLGLALLQAGAAIMSTPGSLGVALGKGVNVGTERYAAGLDKLNAAQERLMDAKDRLEELRVNRDDLTSRERRQLKTQAKQYELEAEKLFLDGAHKKLGYKREDAKNMFAGITTLMGQETAAGATIEAANIRSRDQNAYLAELRGGSMVEQARKNIMADITKNNPYADEPTRQRLFQTEWAKALQSNPALAKYSGVASGGGGASSADPLGLR